MIIVITADFLIVTKFTDARVHAAINMALGIIQKMYGGARSMIVNKIPR